MLRKRQSEFTDDSQSEEEENSENDVEEEQLENELGDENMDENNEDNDNDDDDQSETDGSDAVAGPSGTSGEKPPKKKKRGIIYISSIPKHMNVMILREMLSQYAKIDRVFLQPGKVPGGDKNPKKKKRRLARHFTEGWVEFESKRAAKQVAARLNNSPIATRKSSKFYDILWSMKYLPRFKWVHLSERLTYEKAVHRQKLQTEIGQARKEAAFFQENLDKSDKFKRLNKKAKKETAKKESTNVAE